MATPEPVCYDLEVVVDDHLVSELERHGVPRGRRARLHLELVPASSAPEPDLARDRLASFIGMIDSGESDLAERSSGILQAEFGRQ